MEAPFWIKARHQVMKQRLVQGSSKHWKNEVQVLPALRNRTTSNESSSCLLDIPPISSLVLEDLPPSPRSPRKRVVKDRTDDHTLETVNSDEDESSLSFSSSSNNLSVSFAEPLVTAVWYRPMVETLEEKDSLFYGEEDYHAFRQDFCRVQRAFWRRRQRQQLQSQPQQQQRRVQFPRDSVVTQVHEYTVPSPHNKHDLFYSEQDLERYVKHNESL